MFLDEILEKKKLYLTRRKKEFPIERYMIKKTKHPGRKFIQYLKEPGINIIAEIKRASPSKGLLVKDFDSEQLLDSYTDGGAMAISVLTEKDYFLGSEEVFFILREKTDLPILRKDFIIDEYQIYESAILGANAVLLIARILDAKKLGGFIALARSLDLAPLVEVHNTEELNAALKAGADVIGVNSRDLDTFKTDKEKMKQMLARIPANMLRIAESGIQSKNDILELKKAGADAFLIGEALMTSHDPAALLKSWIA
jgi:indole-3-glycerol phosphate synthase